MSKSVLPSSSSEVVYLNSGSHHLFLSCSRTHSSITTLPVDILELIAEYVSINDHLGPPRGVLTLSSTCRALRDGLGFTHNATVYGNIFRSNFDMTAPLRRFESEGVLPDGSLRTGSAGLAAELKARFLALHYMRTVVEENNLFSFSSEETIAALWSIYFMCIESDVKNAKYLFEYADLRAYAKICMDRYLFQSLDDINLLEETMDRTLMMWITWFATSTKTLYQEDSYYENRMIQFLRPLVYSNFNYNGFFAPWQLFDLPTNTLAEYDGYTKKRDQTNRYASDHSLDSLSTTITLYGAPLTLIPPLLVHAALLSYFARLEKRAVYETMEGAGADNLARFGAAEHQNFTFRLPTLKDSKLYDTDFYRLLACLDPRTSRSMSRSLVIGTFSGHWEGRFAFTDFDSFRDMLDGDNEAIHSSTIAQQPQVWSISEHHSLSSSAEPSTSRAHQSKKPSQKPSSGVPGLVTGAVPTPKISIGPSLTGHLPPDIDFEVIETSPSPKSPLSPSPSSPNLNRSLMFKGKDKKGAVEGPKQPTIVKATYVDPATGIKHESEYETWDEDALSSIVRTPKPRSKPIAHFASSNNTSHQQQIQQQQKRDTSFQSHYSDPYGFAGPTSSSNASSRSNSHPSSSRTSLDGHPHALALAHTHSHSHTHGHGHGHTHLRGAVIPLMTTLDEQKNINGGTAGNGNGMGDLQMEDDDVVPEEEEEDLEEPSDIVLTGKGHSAWGPFLLKGRVRLWDGMINIVKIYAGNDGRGTWLYRGYILNNGIWIGRWRDTMTEESTNGYEGVFAMTKREDVGEDELLQEVAWR